MGETVLARKAVLRERLIDLAEMQMARGGLSGLRARALAQDAGCAVGAIYTHFADLGALALAVNERTLARLHAALGASVADAAELSPTERLIVMSYAYLGFAAENPSLWRALFDLRWPADGPAAGRCVEAHGGLLSLFASPLVQIFPEMEPRDLDLMTQALFSTVHGIVLLGLETRLADLSVDQIEEMLAQVLTRVA